MDGASETAWWEGVWHGDGFAHGEDRDEGISWVD